MKRTNKRRIIALLIGVVLLFISLSFYLVYFQMSMAEDLKKNPNNTRFLVNEGEIRRGSIYDVNGTVLADTKLVEKNYVRSYYYPYSYAHIIGYSSERFGKTGLESAFTKNLLGVSESGLFSELKKALRDKDVGNDMYLTIENELQTYGFELLKNHKGAIIVSNAKTGAILAMTDRPAFNPNQLKESWSQLVDDENAPLINRATQGLYVPGSVMKVLTSIAILEKGIDLSYNDTGVEKIGGYQFGNYDARSYGEVGLTEALKYSINTYFGKKGVEAGAAKLKEVSERFLFNKSIPFDLPVSKSKVSFDEGMEKSELAASSFGQGKTVVTPLQIHLISQAIANDGVLLKPYLVSEWHGPGGNILSVTQPEVLGTAVEPRILDPLLKGLKETASVNGLKSSKSIQFFGKTGTAQNEGAKDHAWFTGFVTRGEESYVVTVILENEGKAASKSAAPLAKKVFQKLLEIRKE
ncbi:peptidoglycan D,D-transpeptidase FtsI family protein [Guggenheimella bovis]